NRRSCCIPTLTISSIVSTFVSECDSDTNTRSTYPQTAHIRQKLNSRGEPQIGIAHNNILGG
ncbi:1863_t:CDS:2, partial [Dentiscutata erythropus]